MYSSTGVCVSCVESTTSPSTSNRMSSIRWVHLTVALRIDGSSAGSPRSPGQSRWARRRAVGRLACSGCRLNGEHLDGRVLGDHAIVESGVRWVDGCRVVRYRELRVVTAVPPCDGLGWAVERYVRARREFVDGAGVGGQIGPVTVAGPEQGKRSVVHAVVGAVRWRQVRGGRGRVRAWP